MRSAPRPVAFLVGLALTTVTLTAVTAANPPERAIAAPVVDFAGDPAFDSNSIADSSSLQPRWNSSPGSRWGMGIYGGNGVTGAFALDMGGYVVGGPKKFPALLATSLGPTGGATTAATSYSSTWYPYQLAFAGTWPAYGALTGSDFFSGKNSVIRQVQVAPTATGAITFAGAVPDGLAVIPQNGSVFVGNTEYGYVLDFYQGVGSNPFVTAPTRLSPSATVGTGYWSLQLPVSSGTTYFVSIGFWAGSESASAGLARAQAAMGPTVETSLLAAKAVMDGLLRSAPVPQDWGVSGVNNVGTVSGRSVTPATHRAMYYRAWAFAVQQLIDPQPDFAAVGFGYPMVAAGKPTLNPNFNTNYPLMAASEPWDSSFGIQLLAYIPSQRSAAIDALRGILTKNVQNGLFVGERLPSRVAQTAWVLYQQTGDLAMLSSLYPLLAQWLDYMAAHPSFAVNANPPETSSNIEYVASWLFDASFMKRIAAELGRPAADIAHWNTTYATQVGNLRTWFFPGSADEIYSFYNYGDGSHTSSTQWANPASNLTALAIPDLPQDLRDRLVRYWVHGHEPQLVVPEFVVPEYVGFDPAIGGAGVGYTRHPDISLIALGLIGSVGGPSPYQFVNAMIRDAVYPGDFAEYLRPGSGLVERHGQMASLFTATQLIDFTLLNNGYSIGLAGAVLSRPAQTPFYSGFEPGDAPNVSSGIGAPVAAGISGVTGICCGATGPVTTVVGVGARSGQNALFFSGNASGTGHVYAYTAVFDLASPIVVTAGTTLQYSIFPQSPATSGNVSPDTSEYVAVDLVFDDGTVLSALGASDQFGNPMTPQGQGAGGDLRPDSWNRVFSVIGAVAAGKRVTRIILGFDRAAGPTGGYAGFIDDLSIANGYTG